MSENSKNYEVRRKDQFFSVILSRGIGPLGNITIDDSSINYKGSTGKGGSFEQNKRDIEYIKKVKVHNLFSAFTFWLIKFAKGYEIKFNNGKKYKFWVTGDSENKDDDFWNENIFEGLKGLKSDHEW